MNVSVQNPLHTEVCCSFESLSRRPATPTAKRSLHFFPSSAATPSVVSSSLDSLSPPPTPIAKRSRHFFPRNAPTPPMPMFFPTSQSVYDSPSRQRHSSDFQSDCKKEGADKEQLVLLATRPAPILRLKPKPRSRADVSQVRVALKQLQVDQFPPLPFVFPETSFKCIQPSNPQLPSPSESSEGSNYSNISKSTPKKQDPSHPSQQMKLPAFQRSGMKHRTLKKRNSVVARSA